MQQPLPLEPLVRLLPPGPFTPREARAVGVDEAALRRMLRAGVVRRVLKGVYVDATAEDGVDLRAAALARVAPRGRVVHGRAASWLWGVPVPGTDRLETTTGRALGDRDVTERAGVRVTTPLRTALDLGRTLGAERALAMLDAYLRSRQVTQLQLLADLPRHAGRPGVAQLRELVARADGRAGNEAESVLRLRWLEARLPTPVPRLALGAQWLELGVAVRRFGAVFSGRLTPGELARARIAGWSLVELDAARVLGSDPEAVSGHLEREYHRHLLRQAG